MARITITQFRAEVSKWAAFVQQPERWVILTSHGRDVAALVSVEDLNLLWEAQDERRVGPINPASGRPFGPVWVAEHFGGRYERERDPEAHLHPSRAEAPWLGRPFEWPRPKAEARPAEAEAEAPAPARRWWQLWRR